MAFLTLTVAEIFRDDRFQPIIPTLIGLLIGVFFLGVFLFIGESFMTYLFDGVFKDLKRLLGGTHKDDKER